MGQDTSKEYARFDELRLRLLPEARHRVHNLRLAAAAEKAAGIPPAHDNKQGLYQAAYQHKEQLWVEFRAVTDRLGVLTQWWNAPLAPKMPTPTPTWEEVLAGLSTAQPSTPAGSSSPARRPCGSSSEEAEAGLPAEDVQLSEAAALLPGGSGPSAPGLRRRQGQ